MQFIIFSENLFKQTSISTIKLNNGKTYESHPIGCATVKVALTLNQNNDMLNCEPFIRFKYIGIKTLLFCAATQQNDFPRFYIYYVIK